MRASVEEGRDEGGIGRGMDSGQREGGSEQRRD